MSMEDSCSSYSFSDSSLDSSASCTCTKMTYSSSPSKSPSHNGHVQLGRSHSEPAIRTADMIKAEEERHGMEPKYDLFSIQLEVSRPTDLISFSLPHNYMKIMLQFQRQASFLDCKQCIDQISCQVFKIILSDKDLY